MDNFESSPFFVFRPREGNPFTLVSGGKISLTDVASEINSELSRMEMLQQLGISVYGNYLEIQFQETGCRYANVKGNDRTKTEPQPTTYNVCVKYPLANSSSEIENLVNMAIYLEPYLEDGVSFLGKVVFLTGNDIERHVPLTGLGTTALEGRRKDCHAGFCTGGACASFQQRAAIILSVAMAIGISDKHFKALCLILETVNHYFHGRRDILHYTIQCVRGENNGMTYLEYMKEKYTYETDINLEFKHNCPEMVRAYLEVEGPIIEYYEKLSQKVPKEDLEDERMVWEANQE